MCKVSKTARQTDEDVARLHKAPRITDRGPEHFHSRLLQAVAGRMEVSLGRVEGIVRPKAVRIKGKQAGVAAVTQLNIP